MTSYAMSPKSTKTTTAADAFRFIKLAASTDASLVKLVETWGEQLKAAGVHLSQDAIWLIDTTEWLLLAGALSNIHTARKLQRSIGKDFSFEEVIGVQQKFLQIESGRYTTAAEALLDILHRGFALHHLITKHLP